MQKVASGLIIVLALGVLAVFAFGLGWKLKPTPASTLRVDTAYVERPQLEAAAPKPKVTGTRRLTHHEVAPELVLIGTVPVGAESTAVASPPDSLGIRHAEPRYQHPENVVVPATLPYLAGRFHGGNLELWVERSDSSLLYQSHRAHAPFDWVRDSAATGIVVHEQRAWLRALNGGLKCGSGAGVGAATGALLVGKDRLGGAIVGALSGCVGSVVF